MDSRRVTRTGEEGLRREASAVELHSKSVLRASMMDFFLLLQGVSLRRCTVSWQRRYSSRWPRSTHTDWRHFFSHGSIHLQEKQPREGGHFCWACSFSPFSSFNSVITCSLIYISDERGSNFCIINTVNFS